MIAISDVVPRGALQVVALWSGLALLACIAGLDRWSSDIGFAVDNSPLGFAIGALAGSWLFVASWWILSGRVGKEATSEIRSAEQWCRAGLLALAVGQALLLAVSTRFGAELIAMMLAGSLTALTWMVLFRQWSSKRVMRARLAKQSALNIRGLMTLTVATAMVISVVLRQFRLEPEMIFASLVLGAVVGAVWLAMFWWVLNGFPLSFIVCLVLLVVQTFSVLGLGSFALMLDEDVVIELVKASIGLGC